MKSSSKHPKGSPRSKKTPFDPIAAQKPTSESSYFVEGGGIERQTNPSEAHRTIAHSPADPARLYGLPELAHGDLALLTSQQEVIVCSHCRVTAYLLGDREARPSWQIELHHPVTAVADSNVGVMVASGGAVHKVGPNGAEPVVRIVGNVRSLRAAGMSVYAVVALDARLDGALLEIDPTRGAIVSERSLRSADTRLSADSFGNYLGLSDGLTFRTMATRPDEPCAGERRPDGSPRDTLPAPRPTDPCCCRDKVESPQPDPTFSSISPNGPERSPCDPGQSGTPTPGGGRVVGDGSGVTYYPPDGTGTRNLCRSHLFFETYYLEAAGSYLIAADREGRNVAVLNASDLGVVHRFQSRQGNVLLSRPTMPVMLVYSRGGKFWEVKRLDVIAKGAIDVVPKTLDPDLLLEVMTFTGSPLPGLKGARAKTTGHIKVLVIPVLDPGQTFNDADLPKLKRYLQRVAYNNVELYYRENSFGLLEYIDFHVHGVDAGSGGAVRMPKPIADYYHPRYVGAHVNLVKSGLTFPATIVFDGRERMTLTPKPQDGGRAASVLNVKFSAILASQSHANFPVKIRFDGTETATISLKRPGGAVATLNLKFTAKTVDIEASNVTAKLSELESYFDGIVAAAEATAGIPGRLFAKPSMRRVDQDGATLGLLVTTLSHTAATGPKLEVNSISYSGPKDHFGLSNAHTGRFSVGASAGTNNLKNYFDYITVLAQEEAGFNYSQRRLAADPEVSADAGTGTLTTTFFISDEDGGPGASMGISNIVELAELFGNATSTRNHSCVIRLPLNRR